MDSDLKKRTRFRFPKGDETAFFVYNRFFRLLGFMALLGWRFAWTRGIIRHRFMYLFCPPTEITISMINIRYRQRSGFTLLELLVVLAIIVALFAILTPTIMSQRRKSEISRAKMDIQRLNQALELYAQENRGYPTSEQGLMALVYVPNNTFTGQPAGGSMMQPGMTQPGMPGMDSGNQFAGNAGSVGPEMFGSQPGTMPGMNNPNMMPGTMPGMNDPNMMPGGTGTTMPGTMPGMNDTNMMPGGTGTTMPGAMPGTTMMGGWNSFVYNEQLYVNARKRSESYTGNDSLPVDPWGSQYRYENNLAYNGLNRNGKTTPAIWSAGPDRQDGTDDDVLGWEPEDAQQAFTQRQQQMQMGTGMTQPGMPGDPTMMQPNMPGMPTDTNMMPGMPNQPMMPNQPGMPTMPTDPTMMQPSMSPPGMPTNPMPSNPMPTNPVPSNPMPR